MILKIGCTQEIPGVGVFKWDGREFWVFENIQYTHGELYIVLKNMNMGFDIKDTV